MNRRFKPVENAESIIENAVVGINRVVKLTVVIDGVIIPFYKDFTLTQSSAGHHRFRLVLDYDVLEEHEDYELRVFDEFLGRRITVVMEYKDTESESPERVFVGVVTKIGFSQEKGNLGDIVLEGADPTILLDAAPHCQSFGGKDAPVNMGIIADSVIRQAMTDFMFDIHVDAKSNILIPYSAQYNETHYNYLCRMAAACGENFYYDGEVLHFGKMPAANDPVILIYGSNVSGIQVQMNAVHLHPRYYGYNASHNEELTSGDTPLLHRSDIAMRALKENEHTFTTKSTQRAPIKTRTDMDVVLSQTGAVGNAAVEVVQFSGETSIPFLFPGCVCELRMRKPTEANTRYFTKIMITDTTHHIDARGNYTGTFKAVASDTGFLPKPEFTVPVAEPQLATVISNQDPQNQGRVQVRLRWQMNETTDWIRVMSPDAGGTDAVSQNRGFVAIPEVGDQVMVAFEHNHPDMPFVLGGMFHGGTALGGGVNNHLRSIQTKSGIKVLMNDDEKSVTILDPSGNTWLMDGQGNISVTAPNDISINAGKNLSINVGANMSTTVGQSQSNLVTMNRTESVGMNLNTSIGMMNALSVGGNFISNITGKLTRYVKGDLETFGDQGYRLTSIKGIDVGSEQNIQQHSDKEVQNNSGEKSKNY